MKLLLVKTSSFGDILHTFPALTDAWRRVDGLCCDWLVEDRYAALPAWHPAVRDTIAVSMRGWRRPPWIQHLGDIRRCLGRLRRERYDLVLDAQGLLKSALLARLAQGPRAGPDQTSAREALASRFYQEMIAVPGGRHAVDRNRDLFARALHYEPPGAMDYGLHLPPPPHPDTPAGGEPYLVFIPGTTWPSKRWPLRYWRALAVLAAADGWRVRIPAGNDRERDEAHRIAHGLAGIEPASSLTLEGLAHLLNGASAFVAVDSGPGHLGAAVGTPGVSIYGATDAALSGARGAAQAHLRADFECAPCLRRRCQFADTGQIHPDCYATVPPVTVWRTLRDLMQARGRPS